MTDLSVLDGRPLPGTPRPYDFPAFERRLLANGLTVISAHVPGRPLLQAQLIVRGDAGGGVVSEDAATAGITMLMAKAMPEGTEHRDAIALVEAAERLGAELGATAGWDSFAAQVEVPRTRLAEALALMAEMTLQPSFPAHEVERLRDERLNDLQQAMADPRRRVERAYAGVIYADGAVYARPAGGSEETVTRLDREAAVMRHAALLRPEASTLILCGDLEDLPVEAIVDGAFGGWTTSGPGAVPADRPDRPAGDRRILVVDRPGAPQSEVRVGHVGCGRVIDDFHALSVMNAVLGGLFNSRLNRLLREERGYTYGVSSVFDMRRASGPFAVRCAVESEVTAPAIADILGELRRMCETPLSTAELTTARDYLVGVFPLRFETSAQVAGALAGLVVHGLPDDELDRYRPAIAAVTADEASAAARRYIHPDAASIVVVGDAARFRDALETAAGGEVEVVRDTDEGLGVDPS